MFFRGFAFILNAVLFAVFTVFAVSADAANSGVTYQGRILKPDGSPLSGTNTQFKLQIRTPDSQNCLMYEEIQAQNLSQSSGAFSLTINDGTGARTDTTGLTLDRIFANRGTMTFDPATCASAPGTYAPNPADGRDLVVLFKDESMSTWEPIPAQRINFVPFAFESKQIAGFTADSLLRVIGAGGDPLTGIAPLSNAQYSALLALANGTSTAYSKPSQLNGVNLPSMNSGEVLGWNGSSWVSTTSTPAANSITQTMLQSSSVGTTNIRNDVSINTSGSVTSAVTTTRDFKILAPSPSSYAVTMLAPALSASYSLTWPMNAGSNGQVLTSDGAGGMTWAPPANSSQWVTNGTKIGYTGGYVGIGTTDPANSLDVIASNATPLISVVNSASTASQYPGFLATNYIDSATGGFPKLQLWNSRGTKAAPSALQAADVAGLVEYYGQISGGSSARVAAITARAEQNFNATSAPTAVTIATTNTGSTLASEKMRVTGDGYVGIGTTSPITNLHLVSSTGQPQILLDSPSGATNRFPSVTVRNWIDGGTAGQALLNLQTSRGNSTTSAPLNSGDTLGLIQFLGVYDAANTNYGGAIIRAQTDQAWTSTNRGTSLSFTTTNLNAASRTEKMRITADGRIGIGTTSPTAALDVAGTINASSFTVNGSPLTSSLGSQSGTASFTLNSNSDGSGSDGGFNFQANGSNLVTISNSGDTVINSTTASNNSSSGALVVSGGLGVAGMVNAGARVSASGSSAGNYTGSSVVAQAPTAGIALTATNNAANDSGYSIVRLGTKNAVANDQYAYMIASSSSGATYSPVMAFGTSSGASAYQERMRIDQNGRVGIGTTNPAEVLHVNGRIRTDNGFYARNGSNIVLDDSGLDRTGTIQFVNDSDLRLSTSLGPITLMPGGGGNVGIGTTAPSFQLHVVGNSYVTGTSYLNTITSGTGNDLKLFANFSSNFGLDVQSGTGFVGIGTSAPGSPLHVKQQSTTSGLAIEDSSSGSTANIYYTANNDLRLSRASSTIDINASSGLKFLTSSTERMRIDSSGNVGIGTTSPITTLDVVGGINATSSLTIGGNGTLSRASGNLQINSTAATSSTYIYSGSNASLPAITAQTGTANVGIGTTAPQLKLDVNGSALFRGPSVGGIDGEIYYDTATHTYRYYDANAGNWVALGTGSISYSGTLWNQSGSNLNYTSGGVGIGTTAPAGALAVSGGTTMGTFAASGVTPPANGLVVSGRVGVNTATPGSELDLRGTMRFTNASATYVAFTVPSSGLTNQSYTWPTADGASGSVLRTNGAGALSWAAVGTVTSVSATAPLQVTTATTTPAISLTSGTATGQTLRWTGSAWSPTKLLYTDLVNASNVSPWPASCGAGQGLTYSSVADAFSCVTLVGGTSAGIANGGNTAGADISIGTNDSFKLGFKSNNTTAMTIDTNGNVGVGTSAPAATLSVNGYAQLKSYSSQPVACSGTTAGAIALTSSYVGCVCNGTSWVRLADGATSCTW